MATRWARVARGLLAAIFASGAAAVSHTVAGGTVSVMGLAMAVTFAAIVSIVLAGRTVSTVRLGASVALSQIAFHLVFSYIGTGDTVMAMGHHDAVVLADAAPSQALDSGMWVGHAIAAVVTLLMLRHGEAAFWRLRDMVLVALSVWRIPKPTLPTPRTRPAERFARPRLFLLRRSALVYRGPPAIRFARATHVHT